MSANGRHPIQAGASGISMNSVAVPANSLQQQPQAQHAAPASTSQPSHGAVATDHNHFLYDLTSFDPLQAHTLQLTASAGLLAPQPASTTGIVAGESSNHMQAPQAPAPIQPAAPQPAPTIPQLVQPSQQAAQQQPTQYYYLQPQNGGTGSLQPIAPATHQSVAAALAPQPAPTSFILPAATPGTTLSTVPATYQQQFLSNTLAATATAPQAVLPNLMMTQHLQSVVTRHPAPLAPAAGKRDGGEQIVSDQPSMKKQRGIAPSVVSSSTVSTGNSNGGVSNGNGLSELDKPPQEASQVDLEKMTPAERRRYERNLREQQRSYKISQQIKELRDVLAESNVPFKPNKYSILLSVVEYIKQLQARAIMLDTEHQKLINTIRQTNEMVQSGNSPSSADETDTTNVTGTSDLAIDTEMFFVQGLDYRSIFDQCPAALGVAALDGRILECNPEFQLLLGFPKEDLLKQSLFNLVRNHQDIFRAMAEMLKGAEIPISATNDASSAGKNHFWSGAVISKRDTRLSMNLTLTLSQDGSPKFFNCALTTTS